MSAHHVQAASRGPAAVEVNTTLSRSVRKRIRKRNNEAVERLDDHDTTTVPDGQENRPLRPPAPETTINNMSQASASSDSTPTAPPEGDQTAKPREKQSYWAALKAKKKEAKKEGQSEEVVLAPPLPIRSPLSTLGVAPVMTAAGSSSSQSSSSTSAIPSPEMSTSPVTAILTRDEERALLSQMASTKLTPEQRDRAEERNRHVPHGETIPVISPANRARPRFHPNRTLVNTVANGSPNASPVSTAAAPSPQTPSGAVLSNAALQQAVQEEPKQPAAVPLTSDDLASVSIASRGGIDAGLGLNGGSLPLFPPGLSPTAARVNLRSSPEKPTASAFLAGPQQNGKHIASPSTRTGEAPLSSLQAMAGRFRALGSVVGGSSADSSLSSSHSRQSPATAQEEAGSHAYSDWQRWVTASSDLGSFAAFCEPQWEDNAPSSRPNVRLRGSNGQSSSAESIIVRLPGSNHDAASLADSSTLLATRLPLSGPARWNEGVRMRADVQGLNRARRFLHPTPAFMPWIGGGQERLRWDALDRDLRRAIINRNPPAAAIPCMITGCRAVLPSPVSWLDHIDNVHAKCVQCDRVLFNRFALANHIRTTPNHHSDVAATVRAATRAGNEPVAVTSNDAVNVPEGESSGAGGDWVEEAASHDSNDLDDIERNPDLVPYCDTCDLVFESFLRLQDHLDFGERHQEDEIAVAEPVVPVATRAPGRPTPALAAAVSMAASSPALPRPTVASVLAGGKGKGREKSDAERCPWPIPCAICLEVCDDITTTLCGHVGCRRCLQMAVARSLSCPTCRRETKLSDLHPLYLPGSLEFPPLKAK